MKKNKKRNKKHIPLKPKTGCWDDLNDTYRRCTDLIAQVPKVAPVVQGVHDGLLLPTYPETFKLRANQLVIASKAMREDLLSIGRMHSGLAGDASSEEDMSHSVNVGLRYTQWIEHYESEIPDLIIEITEHISPAKKEVL